MRPRYVPESEDLRIARNRDAAEYRELLAWEQRSEHRLWINRLGYPYDAYSLPFSHRWDAR